MSAVTTLTADTVRCRHSQHTRRRLSMTRRRRKGRERLEVVVRLCRKRQTRTNGRPDGTAEMFGRGDDDDDVEAQRTLYTIGGDKGCTFC